MVIVKEHLRKDCRLMATVKELRLQFEEIFGMKAPSKMTKKQMEQKINNANMFQTQDKVFRKALGN